jgi:hypothetical protein
VGTSKITACWVVDGEVVEASCARGGRLSVFAFPSVEADAVMIAASRDEDCGAEVTNQVETYDFTIKADGPLQIRDFEVHMPNVSCGRNS